MADVDFDLSDISVFSPENDVFVLVVISSLSLLGISIFLLFTIVKNFIPGLFLYDDLYPTELRGRGPGGAEVTLPACPKLGEEVITDFDQNTVSERRILELERCRKLNLA